MLFAVLLSLLTLLSLLMATLVVATYLIQHQHNKVLVTAVSKYVANNDIEQAISYCENSPGQLAQAMAILLGSAGKMYKLELSFHTALSVVSGNYFQSTLVYILRQVFTIITLLTIMLVLHEIADVHMLGYVCIPIVMVSWVVGQVFTVKIAEGLRIGSIQLYSLRDTLYERYQYVPPQYRPRRIAGEELKEWDDKMGAFESKLHDDAVVDHEALVGDTDGVLG